MKKRLLALFLVIALGIALLATDVFASAPSTLNTGGGVIINSHWLKIAEAEFTYEGSGTLPEPRMTGASFLGWYDNSALSGTAITVGTEASPDTSYYAKWAISAGSGTNGKMAYNYTSKGANANGIKNGERINAFYLNTGFITRYSFGALPVAGSTSTDYAGNVINFTTNTSSDMFVRLGDSELYLARTMSLEGGVVRLGYYVQNRGTSTVSNFNLGVSGDSMLEGNDHVPLKYIGNEGDFSYLQMIDHDAGNELRLYTDGSTITKPDRLWWGGYHSRNNNNAKGYVDNTFNDGKDGKYQEGIDSAFGFSWSNIEVAPGQTKSFSTLLGVGASGRVEMSALGVRYDINGGTGTVPVDAQAYAKGDSAVVLASDGLTRDGYIFSGWRLSSAGGNILSTGDSVYMLSDTTLYAVWTPAPHTATVNLSVDSTAFATAKVELYRYGKLAYELSYADGIYSNANVVKGTYDIYINGKDTGTQITVNKADVTQNLAYNSVTVTSQLNGTPRTDRKVALYDSSTNTLAYSLAETDSSSYQENFIEPGSYDVYIDNQKMETITVTNSAVTKTYNYFTANVEVNKDNEVWVTPVTATKDSTVYPLSLKNGVYTAVLPEGNYAVTVNTQATNTTIIDNTTASLTYFTVTFYNGDLKWEQQIIADGDTSTQPANPSGAGTFQGWFRDREGTTAFDFATAINAPTVAYAKFDSPIVQLGAAAKTGIDGEFTLPNLLLLNYSDTATIKSFMVTVTNGTVALAANSETKASGSGTENLKVSFNIGKSSAEAQAFLIDNLTFTANENQTQEITIKVYSKEGVAQ